MSVDPSVLAALFPQAAPAPQGVSVLLVATPPQLPPKVTGEVISVNKNGQVVIQTEQGEVVIKTELALRVAQAVELRLPPSQPNAPAIATLIANIPIRPEVPIVQTLPPPVLLDLSVQTETGRRFLAQITPTLPLYAAPSSLSPSRTLFQLVGQDVPATLLTQTAAQKPGVQNNNTIFSTPTIDTGAIPKSENALVNSPIDRVQILFLGSVKDARTELDNFIKAPQNQAVISPQKETSAISLSPSSGKVFSAPLLAQLIGLTPQKLPVFEIINTAQIPASESKTSLPQGAQIILHSPVLMTPAEEHSGTPLGAAILVRLPPPALSPEMQFALNTLPEHLPLLTQLLHDPESIMPAAMAAQMRETIPRPNTPSFAAHVIMTLLGLSKADPVQFLGTKMIEALKPEQREQLQKELQVLPTLARDGVQTPDGIKYNFPVEMAGQYHIWQLTLRPPDYDGRQKSVENMSEKPTRFILDFTMSHMGVMQVDGLSFAKTRRLDIILRTTENLQDSLKNELIVQSMNVFEKADLKGSIDFQKL